MFKQKIHMNYQPLIPENLIRKIKEDRGAFTVDSVIELLEGMNQLHYNEFKKEQSKANEAAILQAIDDKKQLEVDAKNIVEMMKF